MKITPLDIRRQEFSRKVRGLDPDEVETFLETLANEFESLLRDNASLKEQMVRLDSQVSSFRELEKTLQDTLISAQKARDDARSDASKEAECILREAELKAERWMEDARQEVLALKRELSTLRNHKASFLARMKTLLGSQTELLNILAADAEDDLPEVGISAAGRNEADRGTERPPSQPPFVESGNTEDERLDEGKGKTDPDSPAGQADGSRRSYRRFYRGRNPQDERQGPAGKG